MVVYLSEYIHPDALALLKNNAEVVSDWRRIEEIDAVILRIATVDRDIMDRAKKLKVIGKHGVGCNTIDLECAREKGIPVFNTPSANTNSVAELIVGLVLAVNRFIPYGDAVSRGKGFATVAPEAITGVELTGKTLGLVGMGNIARRTAEIIKNGFDVNLIGYDPYCSQDQADSYGIRKFDDLNEMIAAADVVNVSVPLTSATENLISGDAFNHFKKSAILINAARGGIVNEGDLYDALVSGRLRGAACDAFVNEPPSGENPLMSLHNFVATPHVGANTEEALYRMGMDVVKGTLEALSGQVIRNRVI